MYDGLNGDENGAYNQSGNDNVETAITGASKCLPNANQQLNVNISTIMTSYDPFGFFNNVCIFGCANNSHVSRPVVLINLSSPKPVIVLVDANVTLLTGIGADPARLISL